MKKTLLIAALLWFLCGCTPRLSSPVQVFEGRVVTSFDFTPYLDRDFIFTAGPYEGEHESRGFISLAFAPRTTEMLRSERLRLEGWAVEQSQVEPPFEQMYERVVALGADGISHFSVEIERGDLGKAEYRI